MLFNTYPENNSDQECLASINFFTKSFSFFFTFPVIGVFNDVVLICKYVKAISRCELKIDSGLAYVIF